MDNFLKRRGADARFALHAPRPEMATYQQRVPPEARQPWFQQGVRAESGIRKASHKASLRQARHNAAAEDKAKASAKSSSSESDGEGGRRKKKKEKKSSEDKDGGNGRCWKGYEPVSGKEPYSDGSCRKA